MFFFFRPETIISDNAEICEMVEEARQHENDDNEAGHGLIKVKCATQ
jgi:hypothetical protein